MEKYIGLYAVLHNRDRFQSLEYTLEIHPGEAGDSHAHPFTLEQGASGQFGSVGTTLSGFCVKESDKLRFHVRKKRAWSNTVVDEEEQINEYDVSETYEAEIRADTANIELRLHLASRQVDLHVLQGIDREDIFYYDYSIVRSIIDAHRLGNSMSMHDEVPAWRIFNLHLRGARGMGGSTAVTVAYSLFDERDTDASQGRRHHAIATFRGRTLTGFVPAGTVDGEGA